MLRILLVDDSEDSRLLVPALLRKYNCQIDTAEIGQIALDRLSASAYDIILMDVQMPVLDGFEATYMFREHKPFRKEQLLAVLGKLCGSLEAKT